MPSLTPEQRAQNARRVYRFARDTYGRLSSLSGAGLLQLLGAARLPLEGLRLQQGGRAALMPEL